MSPPSPIRPSSSKSHEQDAVSEMASGGAAEWRSHRAPVWSLVSRSCPSLPLLSLPSSLLLLIRARDSKRREAEQRRSSVSPRRCTLFGYVLQQKPEQHDAADASGPAEQTHADDTTASAAASVPAASVVALDGPQPAACTNAATATEIAGQRGGTQCWSDPDSVSRLCSQLCLVLCVCDHQQQQQAAAAATHAAAVAAAAASPYGSVLPMTPAAWQMQQQQQRHMEMRAAIAAGNQAAAAGTAAPVAGTAAASADEDDSHSLSPSESAEDRSALQAADRSHRAALGRSSTRSAADSGKIEERSRLRRQQEREREAEMRDLMNDEEAEAEAAAAATPARSKNNSSSKHSSAAAAASSSSKSKSSGVLLDDVDLSEADLKLLDADTKSRTAHNKRMRGLIKEGLLKQERFVRRHLNQLRPFLSEKVLARYEPGGDAAADDQPAPVCKTFVTQPPYILNGQMREYQILGLNWMIQRHENCVAGILGDEMGLGTWRSGDRRRGTAEILPPC